MPSTTVGVSPAAAAAACAGMTAVASLAVWWHARRSACTSGTSCCTAQTSSSSCCQPQQPQQLAACDGRGCAKPDCCAKQLGGGGGGGGAEAAASAKRAEDHTYWLSKLREAESKAMPKRMIASLQKRVDETRPPEGEDAAAAAAALAPAEPPPLGAILQLVKETGCPRKACKAALVEARNDFARAKAALTPAAEAAPPLPPAGARIEGTFEPSAAFDGARPGWIFKRGPLGVGYYRDASSEGCCADGGGGGG